jgi:NAD(P)-dependent dehydrogenase (short-subunit alcohol dehydrogenase family)
MATTSQGQFTGKVVFVTGAGTGIGRATAFAFAREGASVVVTDVTDEDVQETARLIKAAGGRALAFTCHVTSSADVEAALAKTTAAFGRLDYAFNNAGVEQKESLAAETEEAEWDRVINTDLRGVFCA